MTRTTRRLAVAGLAVLLLAGCGDAAAQPGAAAVVGDQTIDIDELRGFVDRGLADPQAQEQFPDRAEYQRQVLNRMVRAELLEVAAAENDVTVTQGDVDAQIADFAQQAGGREQLDQQAAANGISPEDIPSFAREVVLETELGDVVTEDAEVPDEQLEQIYQQNIGQFEQVRSRHILVEDEETAKAALARVQADPESFPEVAAELSTDTSNKDTGGDLGVQGRGTFVPQFDEAVFTKPLNEPFLV
ncbi:MAG: peptidylprolyl isomerase, partial [Actinomycetes bacterium]